MSVMRQASGLIIVSLLVSVAAGYEQGDQLVVVRPVEMKTITGSTHELTPGAALTVRAVEDGKLKVAAPRVGWIDTSGVIPAKQAEAYFSEQIAKGTDKAAALRA